MKAREFLLGESVNGWYIKELGTKDFEPTTFLDAHCLKVRQVLPIDWEKIWATAQEQSDKLNIALMGSNQANKVFREMFQELVEKALIGEPGL